MPSLGDVTGERCKCLHLLGITASNRTSTAPLTQWPGGGLHTK